MAAQNSLNAEFAERRGVRRGRSALQPLERKPKQRQLELDHRPIVHAILRQIGRAQVEFGQQPVFDEAIQTDEQRVAGKGRKTLIGRIAITRRPQGQDLPEALAGVGQKVYELESLCTQLANAPATRQ